ncbi:exopolysaccharide biosynthesis polyprenyl glycosylphosphotransferase [Pseudonocardia hierapolitana]|uniref:Exopolysaccharide biosynthesis polyprenyl glycosylphosphotransferase n=1 Tax=Pseudonocardia hierapolitana TaxID=1128676 RepID=A0A561SVT9_9PSEU|nr:sugar transferase [Pseudonocardia hierapolitana]TWF78965.1 exopolysaccharide biosynthesis polyprenyl glycosylphosphotransferase [Pseudonocardia hierapolitana]
MSSDAVHVDRPLSRTIHPPLDRQLPRKPVQRTPTRKRWQRGYRRAAIVTDLLAVVVSAALYAQWGSAPLPVVLVMGAVVLGLTACALGVARAWDPLVVGHGSAEFSRLLRGFLGSAVVVALVSLASQLPAGRPWVFGVLPIAGAFATAGRLWLRWELHRRRRAGKALARVLAVGTEEAITALVAQTRRAPHEGWRIIAACTPTGRGERGGPDLAGVPVVGDLDAVAGLTRSTEFDAVSVAQAPGWSPRRLQQLAWDLEVTGTELVVEPGLMEIAGPRLHVDSLDGLPLLRLTHPTFTGASRLLKGMLDRVASLLLLLVTAPLLIALSIAVVLDGGPVFFRQTRVGVGGREFKMIKFRSMVPNAEQMRAQLLERNEGAGPLFKMRSDPRVTRVGQFLRRFSLDELPQLFNVLGGSMSLVGPRPPLPAEVAGYAAEAWRRLLVKPGMTGLWQVSGRSDLSWEETLRLDLRYVENWTLALDARILLLTARAVVHGDGAY